VIRSVDEFVLFMKKLREKGVPYLLAGINHFHGDLLRNALSNRRKLRQPDTIEMTSGGIRWPLGGGCCFHLTVAFEK